MSAGRIPTTANSPLTTKGDLFTYSTASAKLAVGANNTVLIADSAQATGLKYANGSVGTLTTTGDILYASAANTPARLGIGSSAQVLTVSGGLPVWSAPAGGGKVLQVVSANCTTDTTIASTTYTTTTITASITPTLNTSKILVMYSGYVRLSVSTTSAVELGLKLLRDATVVADMSQGTNARALEINVAGSSSGMAIALPLNYNYLDSPATTSSTAYTLQAALMSTAAGRSMRWQIQNIPSVITLLEIGA